MKYTPTLSRRATLQWMAATSLASALPLALWGGTGSPAAGSQGYGTDPNLSEFHIPWPLIMESHQLRQTAVLADLILPGSSTAPAPSALGIADFMNEWVSAPYPEQLADRATIFAGIGWLDAESVRRSQRNFLEGDERMRQRIVDDIAPRSAVAPFAAQRSFFERFRFLVVCAYYTTPEGFRDIGYTGNAPLAAYPPMTDEERTRLEGALMKLGLS